VTNLKDDAATMSKLIQFRCPAKLLNAMERAAERQFTSISDIARASIAQAMRANGMLDEPR
jgi:hypothetical protein